MCLSLNCLQRMLRKTLTICYLISLHGCLDIILLSKKRTYTSLILIGLNYYIHEMTYIDFELSL